MRGSSTALRTVLLAGAVAAATAAPAFAQNQGAPAQRLNPTNHAIVLTIPAMLGPTYLGDIGLTIQPNDRVEFSSARVIELLSPTVTKAALDNLRATFVGKPVVTLADFTDGIKAAYNPQTLQLEFLIPPEVQASRQIGVSPLNPALYGTFVSPANFSAYVNARGSLTYVDKGVNVGLNSPVIFLDGAAWSHGLALEGEGVWQPGVAGTAAFQRQGSRLIFDDIDHVIRWTAGDLQVTGQGFQAVDDLAGISLFRSYSVLEPERSVRPAGDQSFRLTRPSDVTITVNGTNVRQLHLLAGSYNLRDFPFTQGANDIVVVIQDDTGRQQTLHFNVFFDQTQLDVGLSEFGLYMGVKSPLDRDGPHYTDELELTGFFRHGVSQDLTLGVNFQIDRHSVMGGYQALWGSPIGTFSLNVAGSDIHGFGSGYAATLTFQRLFQFVGGNGDALNLAATTRSANFGPVGTAVPNNVFSYELSGSYSHAFNEDLFGSITAHYGHGRSGNPDVHDYHGLVGWRLSQDIGIQFDGSYQEGGFNHGWGALISLTWSPSSTSSVRGDYNTRRNDARLSYQDVNGYGVGAYNISADIERSDDGAGINGTANYTSNHAELGLSHFTSFGGGGFSSVTDSRTSVNVGTSLAFADGALAIGRPISQAFAVVSANRNLNGAEVVVNPTPDNHYTASTDWLGNAVDPDLSAYVPRTITVDAPNAPEGYDLGSGSFRVMPPYRAGYNLQVGSEYWMTAFGRLLTASGEPLPLLAGKAIDESNPSREPVAFFTNGQGRFGISGLKPGKWRLEMPTDPVTVYELVVPSDSKGLIRAGDMRPVGTGN